MKDNSKIFCKKCIQNITISIVFCRFAFSRVTSVNTCIMKDLTFLELVDLDPTPMNRIVNIYYPQRREYLQCPHHIIARIATVARSNIDKTLQINQTMKLDNDVENVGSNIKDKLNDESNKQMESLLSSNKELTKVLNEMKEKIENIEKEMEKLQSNRAEKELNSL